MTGLYEELAQTNCESRLVHCTVDKLLRARARLNASAQFVDTKRSIGAIKRDDALDYLAATHQPPQQRDPEFLNQLEQEKMRANWSLQLNLPAEELAALEAAAQRRHDKVEIARDSMQTQTVKKHAEAEEAAEDDLDVADSAVDVTDSESQSVSEAETLRSNPKAGKS